MARSAGRQELFLSVGGTVTPLQGALKIGKSALIEFSGDAEKAFEAVERSMRDMVKDPGAAAKQLTASYSNAFREIRANAQNVLGADSGAGALNVLNANAAREAASAAENRAAAVRLVAEAARAEAIAQGGANQQLTAYAAAATVAEREAEEYAIALREQANTLSAVEGRMNAVIAPGKRIAEVSNQARAGMQQLSFQLGDVATQLAAGTPPSIVFAQQIGQITQAIGLMTNETKGFIGFIGGPWGVALSAALVLLTPLVAKLWEQGDAEKAAAAEAFNLHDAIQKLADATDRAAESSQRAKFEALAQAQAYRQLALDARAATVEQIRLAQAKVTDSIATAKRFATEAGGDGATGAAAGAYALAAKREGDLRALKKQLEQNEADIRKNEVSFRKAQGVIIADRVAERRDPALAVNNRFARQSDVLARQLAKGEISEKRYDARLDQLTVKRDRDLEALKPDKKAGNTARAAATKAERARQRELSEDIAFTDQERQARAKLLDALGKTAVTEEARAQLQREEIAVEAAATERKVKLQLQKGTLDQAEANRLLALNEETRQAKLAAIAKAQATALSEKQLADVRDEVQRSDELLRSQLQLADTHEERARIERKLLDNSYRRETSEISIELAAAFAAQDWVRYAKAIARAADLAERKSNDEKALDRQSEGSYDRYRRELGSIDSINDQIDDLKIDTIRRLGDELAGAATKALGLKGALGDVVGQLIRIGLERQLLGPAADFLFGAAGAGGAGGIFGSIFKGLFATGHVPGFADGIIRGPGTGTSDSIMAWMEGLGLIRVSAGESIMTAQATRDYGPLLQAMNDNALPKFATGMVPSLPSSVARMPGNDTLRLIGGNAGGTEQLVRVQLMLTDDLDARIVNGAAGVAVEVVRGAAPAIAQKAVNDTFSALGRPSL